MRVVTICLTAIVASVVPVRGTAQSLVPLAEATAAGIASGRTQDAGPRHLFVWSLLGTALPLAAGTAIALGTDAAADNAGVRTVLAATLMWGGVMAGPALGYVRGGRAARGWKAAGMRAGFFALAWSFSPAVDADEGLVPDPDMDNIGPWVTAGLFIAASSIYDIATVERYVRSPSRVTMHLVPPLAAGGTHVGLRIAF